MSGAEMIDVLDENGTVVDTVDREEAERDNRITENVLIFVFNSLGKVWVQLRPMNKSHYPGLWDISACGGIISGETHSQAAARETQEETGLEVELKYLGSFLNVFPGDNDEVRKRLSHLYIGTNDEEPVISGEVDEFKLWNTTKLRKHVSDNPNEYIPSFIVELDMAIEGYKNC